MVLTHLASYLQRFVDPVPSLFHLSMCYHGMQVSRQLCHETGRDANELRTILQQPLRKYKQLLVKAGSEPRELAIALQVVGALTPAVAHLLGKKVCSIALCS